MGHLIVVPLEEMKAHTQLSRLKCVPVALIKNSEWMDTIFPQVVEMK